MKATATILAVLALSAATLAAAAAPAACSAIKLSPPRTASMSSSSANGVASMAMSGWLTVQNLGKAPLALKKVLVQVALPGQKPLQIPTTCQAVKNSPNAVCKYQYQMPATLMSSSAAPKMQTVAVTKSGASCYSTAVPMMTGQQYSAAAQQYAANVQAQTNAYVANTMGNVNQYVNNVLGQIYG